MEKCIRGLALFPEDLELTFLHAGLLAELGRPAEAAQSYRRVREAHHDEHFASVEQGIRGHLTRHNLAIVYAEMGEFALAEQEWRQAVRDAPRYRPAWRGLGDILLRQRKIEEASRLCEVLAADPALVAEEALLRSELALARGDTHAACEHLERGLAERPDDLDLRKAKCKLLFERGSPAEAEQALLELAARDPDDPSVHQNLGTLYLRAGAYDKCIAACRRSIELRPEFASAYLHLGHALKELRRIDEAVVAWNEVLKRNPSNAEAAEAIARAGRAPQED